jgi:surface antigen
MVSEPHSFPSWDDGARHASAGLAGGWRCFATFALVMLALTGCTATGKLFNSTVGAGAKTVVNAVAGVSADDAFLGPRIAKALDDAAEVSAAAAQYRALETAQTGAPITWLHGHVYGTVTPGPYVSVAGESRCRTYSHVIYIKSRPEVARSVACRQADGTWKRIGPVH